MRGSLSVVAIVAAALLSACGDNPPAPANTAPTPPAATPAKVYADLTGCLLPAEVASGERLVGERKVEVNGNNVYNIQMKGDESGADYAITCTGSGQTTDFDSLGSKVTGGVRKADLPNVAPKLSNPGVLTLGEESALSTHFWMRGTEVENGFVDKFFAVAKFNAPEAGNYCISAIVKFAAKTGTGSTSLAFDADEWKVWGHTVETGKVFDKPYPVTLTAGEHVVYLRRREDLVSKFKIEKCPA